MVATVNFHKPAMRLQCDFQQSLLVIKPFSKTEMPIGFARWSYLKTPDRTPRRQMRGGRTGRKGMLRRYFSPSVLGDWGASELTQRGPERSPGRKQKRFFLHFYPKKTPLVNKILFDVAKRCVIEPLKWRQNKYRIKYRTVTCLVLSGMWNCQPDLVPKNRTVRSNTGLLATLNAEVANCKMNTKFVSLRL